MRLGNPFHVVVDARVVPARTVRAAVAASPRPVENVPPSTWRSRRRRDPSRGPSAPRTAASPRLFETVSAPPGDVLACDEQKAPRDDVRLDEVPARYTRHSVEVFF